MLNKISPLLVLLLGSCLIDSSLYAQSSYTIDDTLRGTLNKERNWWNVLQYDIYVKPNFSNKQLNGATTIRFSYQAGQRQNEMQIDLQSPLQIDSVFFHSKQVAYKKRGLNSWLIALPAQPLPVQKKVTLVDSLTIFYGGQPRLAKNPPWDGGWIFATDKKGRPWMTVACQGLGASVWYPCKDHQSDEPDQGAILRINVPDTLVAVSNGRLQSIIDQDDHCKLYTWKVVNPINNYNLVPYIGKYVNWKDQFNSVAGKPLDLTYWVLDYNLEKATPQFNRDTPRMLRAFEFWFGPYPFQEDGYQLVESPHLGMEHQSAIAYGNGFANGYRGRDLSGTGWGKDWDYIIVHESGHEWFANNITTKDIADMWVHEGFTMYSEVLFINYHYGREGADAYCKGVRSRIRNDKPIIGNYGVNDEGSGDMYNKGAGLLHHIREMINDDSLFRKILIGLNKDFRHQTITSADVENYFIKKSGLPLGPVFDQYLRATKIPTLEYEQQGQTLRIRLQNCNDALTMPLRIGKENPLTVMATKSWQSINVPPGITIKDISDNYYLIKKEAPSNL